MLSSFLHCFFALEFKVHIVTSCKWGFTRNLVIVKKKTKTKTNKKHSFKSVQLFLASRWTFPIKESPGRSRTDQFRERTLLAVAGPLLWSECRPPAGTLLSCGHSSAQQCEGGLYSGALHRGSWRGPHCQSLQSDGGGGR